MSTTLRFDGMAELRAALKNLPEELRSEGAEIVIASGEDAAERIRAEYPVVDGELKRGVKVTRQPSPFGGVAVVKSTAKHAWLYENGSQTRRNAKGANRGAMPAGNVMVPIAVRVRREMVDSLIDLLKRTGFEVRGNG
jgi:hypothetical protein